MSSTPWFTDANQVFAKRGNLFLIQFRPNINSSIDGDKIFLDVLKNEKAFTAKSVNLPSISITDSAKETVGIGGTTIIAEPGYVDWQPVTIVFNDIMFRPSFKLPSPSRDKDKNAAFVKFNDKLAKAESQSDKNKIIRQAAFNNGTFTDLYHSFLYLLDRAFDKPDVWKGGSAYKLDRQHRKIGNVKITTIDEYGQALSTWTLNDVWLKEFKSPDLSYENSDIREFSITLDYIVASLKIYNPDGSELIQDLKGRKRRELFENFGSGEVGEPFNPGVTRVPQKD